MTFAIVQPTNVFFPLRTGLCHLSTIRILSLFPAPRLACIARGPLWSGLSDPRTLQSDGGMGGTAIQTVRPVPIRSTFHVSNEPAGTSNFSFFATFSVIVVFIAALVITSFKVALKLRFRGGRARMTIMNCSLSKYGGVSGSSTMDSSFCLEPMLL